MIPQLLFFCHLTVVGIIVLRQPEGLMTYDRLATHTDVSKKTLMLQFCLSAIATSALSKLLCMPF